MTYTIIIVLKLGGPRSRQQAGSVFGKGPISRFIDGYLFPVSKLIERGVSFFYDGANLLHEGSLLLTSSPSPAPPPKGHTF